MSNPVDRVVDRLLDSDVPLEAPAVQAAAAALLREEAPLAPMTTLQAVMDEVLGLGPLEALLRDPGIADILVNGPDEVFIERGGRLHETNVRFRSADHLTAAIERAIAPLGLRLDHASPTVDARLPDGSRLHASIPPVALDGPIVAIRRFTRAVRTLDELLDTGAVRADGADLLREAVRDRRTILVSGGTGAGKTTLLNVLSTEIPAGERIVTIEDAAELSLTGHVVRLEARPANSEGAGRVSIRDLVRAALRLRPDRIIVGEVRGSEAFDLVGALNTGHEGSMSTIHANAPAEALTRLLMLAMSDSESVGRAVIEAQIRSAIDLVVQVGRRDGRRVILEIALVTGSGTEAVYRW